MTFDCMQDQFVQEELQIHGVELVTASTLSRQGQERIPASWLAALGLPAAECANSIADTWLEASPPMPKVAQILRTKLRGLALATLTNRYHYVRHMAFGPPDAEWLASRNIVLVYVLEGPTEARPYQLWYGKLPFDGAATPWRDSAKAVYGTLPDELHDGFMTINQLSGILAVEDVHSLQDRWIRFSDPDLEDFKVGRNYEDDETIPVDEWPDFNDVLILAENLTQEGWGVDRNKSDGSGWGGTFEWVYPVDSVAKSIEDLIADVVGAAEEEGPENDAD